MNHRWWTSELPWRRLAILLVGWTVALSLWGPLGTSLDLNGPTQPPTGSGHALVALLGIGVVACIAVGFLLGRWRLLWLLCAFVPIGAAITDGWYVLAMFASSDPTSDTTAVVGVFVLTPFLLALLAAAMGLSGLAGRLTQRRRRDSPDVRYPPGSRTVETRARAGTAAAATD